MKRHAYGHRKRQPGDEYEILNDRALQVLALRGLVIPVTDAQGFDWYNEPTRVLSLFPPPDRLGPLVACVNIWNDTKALTETWGSWYPLVDRVIVVDGAYPVLGGGPSTDGLHDFLASFRNVTYVRGQGVQTDQRTQYCALGRPGEWLFVVDADEQVSGLDGVRECPGWDIGWVTVQSPIYRRPYQQPRLFRWQPDMRYDGRHHWLMVGDRPLATHQHQGTGWTSGVVPVTILNRRGLHHTPERARLKATAQQEAATREIPKVRVPSDRQTGARETLRIAQGAPTDPGLVAYRLHTALNTTTPHSAMLVHLDNHRNPFDGLRAIEAKDFPTKTEQIRGGADVFHCHLGYHLLMRRPRREKHPWVVIHHHGTMLRRIPGWYQVHDQNYAKLRLVSNLELVQYAPDAVYLPNPVPVAEYQALRDRTPRRDDGFFVIAHSPSRPELKATDNLLRVVADLQTHGLTVTVDLIHGVSHRESLARKAQADACFDAYWLGMQCAGIEGAAMGLPVIAGDPDCQREYVARYGAVPYTYANDDQTLAEQITRLMTDPSYYQAEAARVRHHVLTYHDYASVALQYLDALDHAVAWRSTLKRKRVACPA